MGDDVQIQLLREAVRWLRFQSMDRAKAAVTQFLDTDEKKAAFELADGVNSARTVGAKVGVSDVTIGKWWGGWFAAGILVEQDGVYQKLFSLADLGMQAPSAQPKRNSNGAISNSPEKSKKK